jgi:predicted MFS family arabinose efflux permease
LGGIAAQRSVHYSTGYLSFQEKVDTMEHQEIGGQCLKPRFSSDELAVLVVLFSATVIVATGIQMGNALFPSLSRLMGVPVSRVTLLVSVWALTGLLSPIFGPPSDRYGHVTFVLVGLGAFTIGNVLCAVAPSFLVLLAFQVIVGLGYAMFSFSTSAVVGDVFAYETRARATSIVRLAVSVTALVGVPVAAAIAERATARASFGVVGGLGLVVLLVALPLFRRRFQGERTRANQVEANLWGRMRDVVQQRSAMVGLLTVLGWAAVPTGVFIYLAAWLEQAFQLTEAQVGLTFSMAGVVGECSHAGIINTVKQVQGMARTDAVHAVLGGFHLTGPVFVSIIEPTIEEMKKIGPEYVVPMHCTGWKAIAIAGLLSPAG